MECLESVSQLDYPAEQLQVVVVDNGSVDGSVEAVRKAYSGVNVLVNGENLGYAEGNNVGIRWAMDQNLPYLLVLNNDTRLEPGMLTELVRAAEANPNAGMLGPTIYCFGQEEFLFSAGGIIDWRRGYTVLRGMFMREKDISLPETYVKVDFLVGCCVLVRNELIRRIGDLDTTYYLNFEDVEWCVRAKQVGYEILYIPTAKMWHKISASLGLASPVNTYYMTRNALFFFWRNGQGIWKIFVPALILIRTVWIIAAWTIKREYWTDFFKRKRAANLYALRDFSLGRWGKMGADVASVCYVE
jgi:GT2 family glycosyltransferase